jgi:hypothetical protein
MRRETAKEREAWTALIEGRSPAKQSKYRSIRWGKYASKHEAAVAAKLAALASAGKIQNLREQVPIVLVDGKGKIKPIIYIADFTFHDESGYRVLDAKGYKTPVYTLKKKLAALLLNIHIEEV